jgi:hypothetical protein
MLHTILFFLVSQWYRLMLFLRQYSSMMWWSKAKYRSRYMIIFSLILFTFKISITDAAVRVGF